MTKRRMSSSRERPRSRWRGRCRGRSTRWRGSESRKRRRPRRWWCGGGILQHASQALDKCVLLAGNRKLALTQENLELNDLTIADGVKEGASGGKGSGRRLRRLRWYPNPKLTGHQVMQADMQPGIMRIVDATESASPARPSPHRVRIQVSPVNVIICLVYVVSILVDRDALHAGLGRGRLRYV